MSQGMRPYDFVQQVYYEQEKVLLDFIPPDDKYREVLVEANLVLQELQGAQDWTWLREKLILGPCHHLPGSIPEFTLPSWVYKVSDLNHDYLRLMKPLSGFVNHADMRLMESRLIPYTGLWLDQRNFIDVPIASVGDNQYRKEELVTGFGAMHWPDHGLKAIRIGDTITFNRPLTPYEQMHIATIDVQRRLPMIHVCDETCRTASGQAPTTSGYDITEDHGFVNPCAKVDEYILTDIPDPHYVVLATAARHAEGSPPAQSRIAGLQDAAQRALSTMRGNDSIATDPDWADWDHPGYVTVY